MSGAPATADLLGEAVAAVDAPDVVLAATTGGLRTLASGGNASPLDTPREELRYELGSVSKTFAVLLLAELARSGELFLDDPLYARLPPLTLHHPTSRLITLRQLATHTSGLPRIPLGLVPGALLRPHDNAYSRYGSSDVLDAFARTRPRPCPGTRWRYSNLGMALLGLAMEHTTGIGYTELLTARVLGPLGLTGGVALAPSAFGSDAVGHRSDGRTPVPPAVMGGFKAAGAARATPSSLVTYLEAHLAPGRGWLAGALRDVQRPVLRRGWRHRHTHTLAWYLHPGPGGPLLFHVGATFGQQAFLGYHPATGTGLVALATRRDLACRMVHTAYELLHTLAGQAAA